jgi:carboxypeptidase PM20D1
MRRLLLLLGAAGIALAAVVVGRATLPGEAPLAVTPVPQAAVPEAAAERLAGAIRLPTVSHEDPAAMDGGPFQVLHAYLEAAFPLVHRELGRETVATHSLLYTWPGSDPSLAPILLMGHLDVVPVEPGTEGRWQEEPFGGRIADGFIWGRGAIDNKSTVMGTLEAVEMLLAEGFRPARTLHLAYGHDEEVGGTAGARGIAALLRGRGVTLEVVLDEGGVIADGVLPGIRVPLALVGIAEKGFLSVELSTQVAGGHSSLPPAQTAIGILSAAIARLEENPMAPRLEGPTRLLFERIAPWLPFGRRVVMANLWLTRGLVVRSLEANPTTNAMVRTTMAPTLFQAGTKDNVLPSRARGVLNFRVLPGDSTSGVIEHVRRVIDDERVEVRPAGRFSAEPSAVSSTEAESYRRLERAIRTAVPDAVVAPYLVVVVTDARHYAPLGRNVLRFLPVRLGPDDLARMHGTNERIGIREYEAAVRVYRQVILEAAGR